MEATLISSYTERKQAHVPRPSTSIQSYSSMSSSAPSDNDDDTYYSDVESDAASVASVTSSLGDFLFDSEEEYADYYEVVRATIKGSHSASQTPAPSQQQQPRQKTKKSYRKSTSSFFFASSSLPRFSASFASQNPGLQAAASNLSAKMAKLNSYSRTIPRELQVQDEHDDHSYSTSSGSSSSSLDTESDSEPASPVYGEGCNVDERFERAMLFAQWNKRGRSGEWEAPLGANPGLLELVAMAQ